MAMDQSVDEVANKGRDGAGVPGTVHGKPICKTSADKIVTVFRRTLANRGCRIF